MDNDERNNVSNRHHLTAFRMMDVRVRIAALGNGLDTVEKINAGSYVLSTLDGRTWSIERNKASKLWYGTEL
jgi:hypothetical protein